MPILGYQPARARLVLSLATPLAALLNGDDVMMMHADERERHHYHRLARARERQAAAGW